MPTAAGNTALPPFLTETKNGPQFDPLGMTDLMRRDGIVTDTNGTFYAWTDETYYRRISEIAVRDYIYNIVADAGLVLSKTKVNDTISFAESRLRADRVLDHDTPARLIYGEDYPDPYYTTDPTSVVSFDNRRWLNVEKLRYRDIDPNRNILCTRHLAVPYIPLGTLSEEHRADADMHLLRLMSEDVLVTFYQALGYILFESRMFPPYIFHFYGPGRTGKSLVCDMIASIIGEDNVSRLSILSLSRQFGVDRLRGKWVNIATETETSQASNYTPIDTELLKKLAGGEVIDADRKYAPDGTHFRNTAKLIFASNAPLILNDPSSGMNRRIITIPFHTVQEDNSDIRLILMDPEVQSWIVARALEEWLAANGTITQSELVADEAKYRKDFDSWSAFFTASFEDQSPSEIRTSIVAYKTTLARLYDDYCAFCSEERFQHPLGKKKFNERCRIELGLRPVRSGDTWYWREEECR